LGMRKAAERHPNRNRPRSNWRSWRRAQIPGRGSTR
jgi:hypothetical protein